MAPPPEYDKEPKAPDKNATTTSNEDSKFSNSINDQQTKSDHKTNNTVANNEGEKSKADNSVENLDDGRLRALLDEAITYKCPKDREGKSDLFKNLLEEAEQDDQASEAAARCSGGRVRRGAGRRALAHSNSLQDLVAAALAAEPAPRRPRPHAPVSARATHGGSLPSGVDTSFLLGEEPTRGGYLATVRCVNPPPLAERRVSASDANCPAEVELLHRRSKPVFPMTYTARATLEIGSGSVSSGRAVTTTTASNQVRTFRQPRPTFGPPERIFAGHSALYDPSKHQDAKQTKLMNALLCSRNKNVSEHFESDLRGPRSENANSGSPWSEIIARYSPATNFAIQIKPPPEDTATRSATRSTEPFSGNKITTLNTCTDLSLEKKLVMPTCDNPSTHNKLKATTQTTKTNAKKSNKPSCLISPSYDKTHPTTRFKPSLENKKTSSTAHIAPFLVNKKATLSSRNRCSLSETKIAKFISQTALSQENQTTSHACETKPSPKNRRMVPHYPQTDRKPDVLMDGVAKWYEDLSAFEPILKNMNENILPKQSDLYSNYNQSVGSDYQQDKIQDTSKTSNKQYSLPRNPCNTNMHHSASNITVCGKHREKKIGKSLSNTISNCEDVEYEDYKTYGYEVEQHSKPSENISDMEESDIRLRKKYRKNVGHSLAVPSLCSINPRNIRPMSIGKISAPVNETPDSPKNKCEVKSLDSKNVKNVKIVTKVNKKSELMKTEKCDTPQESPASEVLYSLSKSYDRPKIVEMVEVPSYEFCTHIEQNCKINDCNLQQHSDIKLNKAIYNPSSNEENIQDIELVDIVIPDKEDKSKSINMLQELKEVGNEDDSKEMELKDITSNRAYDGIKTSFEQYYCEQQNFLKMLKETTEDTETNNYDISQNSIESLTKEEDNNVKTIDTQESSTTPSKLSAENNYDISQNSIESLTKEEDNNVKTIDTQESSTTPSKLSAEDTTSSNIVIKLNKKPEDKVPSDQYILAELPNNAYVFLTMPERLFTPAHNTDKLVKIQEIPNDDSANVEAKSNNVAPKNTKKKKDKAVGLDDAKKKENLNKTALKVLLFENLKRDSNKAEASSEANKEGDSAIPFSCITTPEVVSSCNTTSSSTSQSAVAVDPKPLQLNWGYRAVASVTGGAPAPCSARSATAATLAPCSARSAATLAPSSARPAPAATQPRSVISSSFNGLTLSRPNYGATAAGAADEYKKSLDENGNAVQGFSSPISGSSQHKKPRRKKSSKNETVIKSHQIDGYQGNKDLNEVLRFIESNAEHGRGAKLGRAKHKDDADDKAGKKRSSERRKDKESKLKRASSLEERSRTKLEDLTDAPPPRRHERKPRPDNKAERRSWGDDARDAFYYPEPEPAPAPPEPEPELDHEPEPEPVPEREPEPAPVPAPAPPPAPPDTAVELTDFQTVTKRRKPRRRTDDAEREPPRRPRPPSPRPRRESAPPSDRSNDSNDDLDSVHSLPPPPPPPAPHASYADIARTRHNIPDLIESCNFYAEGESAAVRRAADAPAAAGDADGYPALGGAARLARGKAPPRRERKERAAAAAGGECPAPDVVGDRRPAVILLDSAARPRDMDGVTFGFDINEQLLGAGGRRPRCDLVRDAPDALAVRAGAGLRALRYRPPDPPPDTNHLHQIIDYVASAWEDVIRCGGGKVRYFSD